MATSSYKPTVEKAKGAKTKIKTNCGSCLNGIVISNGNEIQRCDDCAVYPDDEAAVSKVQELLKRDATVEA